METKKYFISTVTVGIGNTGGYILNLVFFLLAARFLVLEDFGIFRYFVAVGMILYNSLFAGVFTTMSRFIGEGKHKNVPENVAIFAAQVFCFSIPIMFWVGGFSLILIALSFFISQFIYSWLRGMRMYIQLSIYFIITNGFRIILLGSLAVFPPNVLIFSVFSLLAAILPLPLTIPRRFWRLSECHIQISQLKKILRFSAPLYVSSIAYILVMQLDAVFVRAYLSTSELAYYMSAKTLMAVFMFAPSAVGTVILPETAKDKQLKKNLCLGLGLTSSISLFLALIFYAFPDEIMHIFYPEAYLPAAFLLPVLSTAMMLFAISDVFASTWTGFGKPIYEGFVLGVTALVNFALLYFLVPSLGTPGAAISLTVACGIAVLLWGTLTFLTLRRMRVRGGM